QLAGARFLRVDGRAIGPVSAAMKAAVERVAQRLAQAGARVEDLDCDGRLARLVELHRTIMAHEAARNMAAEAGRPDLISPAFAELVATGRATGFADYLAARSEVARHAAWLSSRMQGTAGLLAPAAPDSAPAGLDATGSPHMSRPWQVLGLPAATWPAATDADGMPLGVQLIGRRWGDAAMLEFAGQIALMD
ncbi:MAG TPA: amidase family protein, partial [Paracoccus sp. (in: a-proteobacteria)]|nr:amidase family protein [Paracoccus sp. (in: a-proteobacteria)]